MLAAHHYRRLAPASAKRTPRQSAEGATSRRAGAADMRSGGISSLRGAGFIALAIVGGSYAAKCASAGSSQSSMALVLWPLLDVGLWLIEVGWPHLLTGHALINGLSSHATQ